MGKTPLKPRCKKLGKKQACAKARSWAKHLVFYNYDKELKGGLPVAVETLVFSVKVNEMRDDYPEASQRKRKWVSPAEAANMVQEPQLQDMLRSL